MGFKNGDGHDDMISLYHINGVPMKNGSNCNSQAPHLRDEKEHEVGPQLIALKSWAHLCTRGSELNEETP